MRALAPVVMGVAVAGVSWCAQAAQTSRTLTFYNIHTKETVTSTYKRDGKFVPEAMARINRIMRDWRRDKPTGMDPELIDTIWRIYQEVGSQEPIHLISAYRSKKTNEALRRRGGGQARNSQHILGKAADIHFPDIPVKKLRNTALVRQAGGVGYYPKSGLPFVHVDTGRVRHWPRLPRQELATLFPQGKSKHVPSDGRPITARDSRIALARLDRKIDDFIAARSKIRIPRTMMLAGFTPPSLKRPKVPLEIMASMETTASIAPATPPAPALGKPAPRGYAIAVRKPGNAEHRQELSFRPFTVALLLGDERVSSDRALAQLSAPGEDEKGVLFKDPETSYSASLGMGFGYTQRLAPVRFGARGDNSKRIITASR